jgi:predicted enzyme related to lactoylglutathione lyase
MPGQIVHIEIPADDTEKSRDFWGSLFGWQFQAYPGPSEYHMTRIGESQGAAITNMEPGKKGARAYFEVDDIKAGVARVRELGGEAGDQMPVPKMGWFSTCQDPHGNDFGLWQNDESAPDISR